MFPPKGAPSGPRSLRSIRQDVGRPQPDPAAAGPAQNTADVTLTCPKCGEQVRQSFTAEPDADDAGAGGGPPVDASQPLNTSGGGPV